MNFKDFAELDVKQLLNNKTLIINILIIVVAVVVAQNVFKRQTAQFKELQAVYAAEEELSRQAAELVGLEQKIRSTEAKFRISKSPSAVRNSITSILESSAVTISSLSPAATVAKNVYAQYPISVEMQGSFHALGKFIGAVENADPMLYVQNLQAVDIGPDPKNTENDLLKITVKMWGIALKQ